MRALLLVALVACAKSAPDDWKPRSGPGFTVIAPAEAKLMKQPVRKDMPEMIIYMYRNTNLTSLQVQVVEMAPSAKAMEVLARVRERIASATKIESEAVIPLGDAPGVDLRYEQTLPPYGKLRTRHRLIVQGRHLYQVVGAAHVDHADLLPSVDRFVESFDLTTKSSPETIVAGYADALGPGANLETNLGEPSADGWFDARHDAGGFAVRMPAPYSRTTATPEPGITMHMIAAVQMPARIKFVVTCIVKPGGTAAERLRETASKLESAVQRNITINGQPAIELEGKTQPGMIALVARDDRICMAVVEPFASTTKLPVDDARKMFASLRVD